MPFPSVMGNPFSTGESRPPILNNGRLFTEELTWVMRMWFLKLHFFVESPFLFSENKQTVGTQNKHYIPGPSILGAVYGKCRQK